MAFGHHAYFKSVIWIFFLFPDKFSEKVDFSLTPVRM